MGSIGRVRGLEGQMGPSEGDWEDQEDKQGPQRGSGDYGSLQGGPGGSGGQERPSERLGEIRGSSKVCREIAGQGK